MTNDRIKEIESTISESMLIVDDYKLSECLEKNYVKLVKACKELLHAINLYEQEYSELKCDRDQLAKKLSEKITSAGTVEVGISIDTKQLKIILDAIKSLDTRMKELEKWKEHQDELAIGDDM